MSLILLLPLLQGTGCVYIDDETHADRLDWDQDGVSWPDDCDDRDADVQSITWYRDADEDGYGADDKPFDACDQPTGYVAAAGDCDDDDDAQAPGQVETCNDIDDNCDGLVDNDAALTTYYRDSDEDGYGDNAITAEGCDPPSGYVALGDDCDDGNDSIHPNAEEFCDTIDQDCDGEAFDPESLNATIWYLDADTDGYGTPDTTTTACSAPSGYSGNDQDCDDTDIDINPAATEICDPDDDDENCNGLADDLDNSVDSGSKTTFYLDDDGDSYGRDDVSELRCDASGGYAASGGDCDDSNALRNPGAPEVCDEDNIDEDCDDLADDADSDVSSATYSTWFPDSDGDGYGDVDAVGVDQCDPDSTYSADNDTDCDDTDASVSPDASEVCDDADFDENCNGVADDDDSTTTDFETFYLDGDSDGYGDPATSIAACELPGGFADNDDDCDDGDAGSNPGASEVWYDGADQDCDGGDDYDADGDGYQSADYSGDDCDDAYDDTNPGASEVCSDSRDNDCDGTSNGCGLAGTLGTSDALVSLTEQSSGDDAGSTVAWIPDLDGDGTDELLVGARSREDGSSRTGSVYLVMGPVTASGDLSGATAEYVGNSSGAEAGTSLASLADATGAAPQPS